MTWLSPIIAVALVLAQTDRIPVDCSVSTQMGSLQPGVDDVTAMRCEDRAGFFVPSARYRLLYDLELEMEPLREELETLKEQNQELEAANLELTASSSAAEVEIDALHRMYRIQTLALDRSEKRAERGWYDHPGFWVGLGIVGTVATVLVVGSLIPDRIISP